MQLPNLPRTTTAVVRKLFNGKSHVATTAVKKISPHITEIGGIVVEHVSQKADYAPDIRKLYKQGMSVKNIAVLLGISVSYVYKLLKNK